MAKSTPPELSPDLAEDASARDFFQALIAEFAGPIVLLDERDSVRYVNSSAAHLLGQSRETLIDSPFPYTVPLGERRVYRLGTSDARTVVEMHRVPMTSEGTSYSVVQIHDITPYVRRQEEWRTLSLIDQLTGLYNRRGFLELAQQQIKIAQRFKRELILLYIDVDGLKVINDTLGHQAGDSALFDVAILLTQTFRESDILARLGGDEFVVMAVSTTGEDPEQLRRRFERSLNDFNIHRKRPYTLSVSTGIVRYDPNQHHSLNNLLDHADRMMYRQKLGKQN